MGLEDPCTIQLCYRDIWNPVQDSNQHPSRFAAGHAFLCANEVYRICRYKSIDLSALFPFPGAAYTHGRNVDCMPRGGIQRTVWYGQRELNPH